MLAKTINPQFYLGVAFATLSIVALVLLLVLVSERTISDLETVTVTGTLMIMI